MLAAPRVTLQSGGRKSLLRPASRAVAKISHQSIGKLGTDFAEPVIQRPRQRRFLAVSRKMNFWILPVDVFGSGPKTTALGILKLAMLARQKAMMSSAVAAPPGLRVTNAQGVSPH